MGFTEKFDPRELCKKPKYRETNWLREWGTSRGGFDNFLIYEGLGKKGVGLVFLRVGCPMHIYIYIYLYISVGQELGLRGTSSDSLVVC